MQLLARSAKGASPYVGGFSGSADAKRRFLRELADAYWAFLPGGRESLVSNQLAARLAADRNAAH